VSAVLDRLESFNDAPGVTELLARRPHDPVQVRR
jgi:hypothetical protein